MIGRICIGSRLEQKRSSTIQSLVVTKSNIESPRTNSVRLAPKCHYLESGEVGGLGCALQGDPALPVDVHDEGVRVRGEVAAVLKLNLLQCNGTCDNQG